jgi:hypothetical protein
MSRISMIATALIVGLLAGSAGNARATSKHKNDQKEKAHKIVGLSPVDFPHKGHGDKDGKHHDHHGKDHCGNDQCSSNDPCKNGSKPPKEYMGGSVYSPPGTPGNPVMPSKPTPPTTPIKYHGLTHNTLAVSLQKQTKGLTPPGGGRPGQGRVPNQGAQIPNIGTGLQGFTGAVGEGVHQVGSTAAQIAEGMYTGVSGLVGEAGSILGDIF